MGRHRDQVDRRFHARGERSERTHLRLERGTLLRRRELAVPQQPGDLLEAAPVGELLHGITAVEQGVRFGIDLGDRGGVDDDAREPLPDIRHASPL
jgi:hypothetical protein